MNGLRFRRYCTFFFFSNPVFCLWIYSRLVVARRWEYCWCIVSKQRFLIVQYKLVVSGEKGFQNAVKAVSISYEYLFSCVFFCFVLLIVWILELQNPVRRVEVIFNFSFHSLLSEHCPFETTPIGQIIHESVGPLLYFAALWVLYIFHWMTLKLFRWIRICRGKSLDVHSSRGCFGLMYAYGRVSAYVRTTTLFFLVAYPSLLQGIFLYFQCSDIPVSSSVLFSWMCEWAQIGEKGIFFIPLEKILDFAL